jgi:hypothetical protein
MIPNRSRQIDKSAGDAWDLPSPSEQHFVTSFDLLSI